MSIVITGRALKLRGEGYIEYLIFEQTEAQTEAQTDAQQRRFFLRMTGNMCKPGRPAGGDYSKKAFPLRELIVAPIVA